MKVLVVFQLYIKSEIATSAIGCGVEFLSQQLKEMQTVFKGQITT